jgi:hypothetical protein
MTPLYGLEVFVDANCVTYPWVFPQHRFFEWEAKDEKGCRALGIGHEGPPQPTAYQVWNRLYMHPTIYAQIKKEIPTTADFPWLGP